MSGSDVLGPLLLIIPERYAVRDDNTREELGRCLHEIYINLTRQAQPHGSDHCDDNSDDDTDDNDNDDDDDVKPAPPPMSDDEVYDDSQLHDLLGSSPSSSSPPTTMTDAQPGASDPAQAFGDYLWTFNEDRRHRHEESMDVTDSKDFDLKPSSQLLHQQQRTHVTDCSVDFAYHSMQYLFDRELWKFVEARMTGSGDLNLRQSQQQVFNRHARRTSSGVDVTSPRTRNAPPQPPKLDRTMFKPSYWFVINHRHSCPYSYQSLLAVCSDVIMCSEARLHEMVMLVEMLYLVDPLNVGVLFSGHRHEKRLFGKFVRENFQVDGGL